MRINPAGLKESALFWKKNYQIFTNEWELAFLPCLNPYGYDYGIRENHEGKDLNRVFKHDSPPQEVMCAMTNFDNSYDLTIDYMKTLPALDIIYI